MKKPDRLAGLFVWRGWRITALIPVVIYKIECVLISNVVVMKQTQDTMM